MSRAAIDLGSNSAVLLVLGDDGTRLLDQGAVVGLGTGLGDGGAFAHDRMHAALEALAVYSARAQYFGVPPEDVVCVATSAARRASNAEAFFHRVHRATGLRFDILEGTEEARLTWLGATSDLGEADAVVLDIGGGSTEIVWGHPGGSPTGRVSLEIGTVRHTEALLGLERHDPIGLPELRAQIAVALDALPEIHPGRVVGVAGSALTLAAVHFGHDRLDPSQLHGLELPLEGIEQIATRLLQMTPDQRRAAVPASPERAQYLVAGATLAAMVLRHLGVSTLTTSTHDLRDGALLDHERHRR